MDHPESGGAQQAVVDGKAHLFRFRGVDIHLGGLQLIQLPQHIKEVLCLGGIIVGHAVADGGSLQQGNILIEAHGVEAVLLPCPLQGLVVFVHPGGVVLPAAAQQRKGGGRGVVFIFHAGAGGRGILREHM